MESKKLADAILRSNDRLDQLSTSTAGSKIDLVVYDALCELSGSAEWARDQGEPIPLSVIEQMLKARRVLAGIRVGDLWVDAALEVLSILSVLDEELEGVGLTLAEAAV